MWPRNNCITPFDRSTKLHYSVVNYFYLVTWSVVNVDKTVRQHFPCSLLSHNHIKMIWNTQSETSKTHSRFFVEVMEEIARVRGAVKGGEGGIVCPLLTTSPSHGELINWRLGKRIEAFFHTMAVFFIDHRWPAFRPVRPSTGRRVRRSKVRVTDRTVPVSRSRLAPGRVRPAGQQECSVGKPAVVCVCVCVCVCYARPHISDICIRPGRLLQDDDDVGRRKRGLAPQSAADRVIPYTSPRQSPSRPSKQWALPCS